AGASLLSDSELSGSTMISDTELACQISANDDTYASAGRPGFIVSDGQGQLTTLSVNIRCANGAINAQPVGAIIIDSQLHKMAFDNHLQAL
ncbi:MAG: hypothetical protein WAX17_06230, partial [Psychrobacter urativorans]